MIIPTWVRRGMKVVCVCDDASTARLFAERGLNEIYPVNRGIYTIRSTFFSPVTGVLCVRLVEIVNKRHHYAGGFTEGGFAASSFKPLVDDANTSEAEAELFRSRCDRRASRSPAHQPMPEKA